MDIVIEIHVTQDMELLPLVNSFSEKYARMMVSGTTIYNGLSCHSFIWLQPATVFLDSMN